MELEHDDADMARRLRRYAPTPFALFRRHSLTHMQADKSRAKLAELNRALQARWKNDEMVDEKKHFVSLSRIVTAQVKVGLALLPEIEYVIKHRKASKAAMTIIESRAHAGEEGYPCTLRIPRFCRVLHHFGRTQKEQRKVFEEALSHFTSDNTPENAPCIGKQRIDLFALYSLVVSLGGFVHVCTSDLWEATVVKRMDLQATDKASALLVQCAYYTTHLNEFEDAYQYEHNKSEPHTQRTYATPKDSIVDLPLAPPTNSLFTNNYYRGAGISAILFALRSRVQCDVLWAINQLLFVSYNANRPFMFDESPPMLEIIVALLQQQLLVIDTSSLNARNDEPHIHRVRNFLMSAQSEDHRITWPNVVPGLLLVLRNLSFVPSNHSRIANHASCLTTCLKLAESYPINHDHQLEDDGDLSISDMCGTIIGNVSANLRTRSIPMPSLSRYIYSSLSSVHSKRRVRALRLIARLATNSQNHYAIANSLQADIFSLLVALCASSHAATVLASLEALHACIAIGERFLTVLVQKTDVIHRVAETLQFQNKLNSIVDSESLVPIIQRTAAAMLAALFKPDSNKVWLVAYESRLFAACALNYEVAAHLSPILFRGSQSLTE